MSKDSRVWLLRQALVDIASIVRRPFHRGKVLAAVRGALDHDLRAMRYDGPSVAPQEAEHADYPPTFTGDLLRYLGQLSDRVRHGHVIDFVIDEKAPLVPHPFPGTAVDIDVRLRLQIEKTEGSTPRAVRPRQPNDADPAARHLPA